MASNSSKETYTSEEDAIQQLNIRVPFNSGASKSATTKISDAETVKLLNENFAMKSKIYQNVLAPELSRNEELKRSQKEKLMDKINKLISFQFKAMVVIIAILLIIIAFSNRVFNLDKEIIKELISFLRFYITAIIAELIAILFFIVKNVFDKSIIELFSNFDNDNRSK